MVMFIILVLAMIGFGISLHTYQIEQKVLIDPNYKAACDINDRISCTKPMRSEYGSLVFFSNAVWGMIYYLTVAVLSLLGAGKLIFLLTLVGFFASLVMAYILYFKIRSLCLLCTFLYAINILLLILSLSFVR